MSNDPRYVMGRRLPDVGLGELPLPIDELQPGDIWRYVSSNGDPLSAAEMYPHSDTSGNLTDEIWGFFSPDGNGIGTMVLHTVRSNDDGTVSILPGDGSSNSVLYSGGVENKTWHGYVYNNEWRPC